MSGEVLAWVASILLGAVLVVAGAAKLAGGRHWAAQVSTLGIDARLAALVPWCEIVVGAVVATRLSHPLGPIAAIALLAAFTVWLVTQLLRGVVAECACFGGISRRPMSWRDVARNAALLALAVIALAA